MNQAATAPAQAPQSASSHGAIAKDLGSIWENAGCPAECNIAIAAVRATTKANRSPGTHAVPHSPDNLR